MDELLGSSLHGKTGSISTSNLGNSKYILIYFSAHWCPPCRGFTPKLGMFYDSVNATEKKLEVVYISADRSEEQFNEYYEEMPWVAVPYSETARRNQLAQKFHIQGIPALFLVDQKGNVKKDNCRMDVTNKGPLCLTDWDGLLDN